MEKEVNSEKGRHKEEGWLRWER